MISLKVLPAFLVPVLAALLLYLLTGDDTYLVGILVGLVSGGAAIATPPAPGVSQLEVARLASRKRRR